MERTYMFFTETRSGELTEWRGLTKTTALRMYNATQKANPDNIRRFGWELSPHEEQA